MNKAADTTEVPVGAPDPSDVPVGRVTGLADLPSTNAPIIVKDPLNDGVTPQPKVIAAALAGLVVTLVQWAMTGSFDEQEVAGGLTAIIMVVLAYVVPNK